MTSREQMANTIRSLYAARVRGDLDAVMKDIAKDATFGLNGRGTGVPALAAASKGEAAIRPIVQELINVWRFDDWTEHALLIDGERAMIHWSARATCIPTKRAEKLDVYDLITFRDGKIVEFRQSTDTAMIMKLAAP